MNQYQYPGHDDLMPVLFVGHGDPMHALRDNPYTRSLRELGRSLPARPRAVCVVSAHWLTKGTFVTTTAFPQTIYDFYGFPDELYRVQYTAPGAPEAARQVTALIHEAQEAPNRGLDHGAWAVLKHLFPEADVPVFQLSIDHRKPMEYHFALAGRLRQLRGQGVLFVGSGNIVHNLELASLEAGALPYDWAVEFDGWVAERIIRRDFGSLVHYATLGPGVAAELSVPDVDHYVPLLYALALAGPGEEIRFTYEEVVSSISMRCLRIG